MTIAALMMKRLLIGHNRRFIAAFKFDCRNCRQQFWFRVGAGMTISANGSERIWIFFQQIHCQRGRAVSRPHRLMRWSLDSFRRRLRGVMTINTGNRFRQIGTAILADMIYVVEGHLAQLRFLRQHDCLWRFCLGAGCVNQRAGC